MADPPICFWEQPVHKKYGIFCSLGHREHFWSSQKITIFGEHFYKKSVGIGDPSYCLVSQKDFGMTIITW